MKQSLFNIDPSQGPLGIPMLKPRHFGHQELLPSDPKAWRESKRYMRGVPIQAHTSIEESTKTVEREMAGIPGVRITPSRSTHSVIIEAPPLVYKQRILPRLDKTQRIAWKERTLYVHSIRFTPQEDTVLAQKELGALQKRLHERLREEDITPLRYQVNDSSITFAIKGSDYRRLTKLKQPATNTAKLSNNVTPVSARQVITIADEPVLDGRRKCPIPPPRLPARSDDATPLPAYTPTTMDAQVYERTAKQLVMHGHCALVAQELQPLDALLTHLNQQTKPTFVSRLALPYQRRRAEEALFAAYEQACPEVRGHVSKIESAYLATEYAMVKQVFAPPMKRVLPPRGGETDTDYMLRLSGHVLSTLRAATGKWSPQEQAQVIRDYADLGAATKGFQGIRKLVSRPERREALADALLAIGELRQERLDFRKSMLEAFGEDMMRPETVLGETLGDRSSFSYVAKHPPRPGFSGSGVSRAATSCILGGPYGYER